MLTKEKKILLIEDDQDHAELISDALKEDSEENIKTEVILKKDGREAIEYFQCERQSLVSLIILDINLPKIDGMDVLKFIKKDSKYCSVPVIILSTSSNKITIDEAYKSGASGYFTKPSSYEALVEKVKNCLKEILPTRKEIEGILQESEEKYRKLIEIANDAIFLVDAETGIILEANNQTEELLGVPVEEIVGMHYTQIYPPEDVERNKELFNKYSHFDKSISLEDIFVQHKDGRKIPVEISSSVCKLGDKKVILDIFRDITERKQAEEALRRMATQLANVVNSTPDLIFVKDMELRTIMCNEAFAKAIRKKPEDVIGKTDIENGWDPELVHGNPEKGIRGFENDDWQALNGHEVHNPNDPANVGDEIRIFDTRKLPLRGADGQIIGVLGIARDITERKKVEETLREQKKALEQKNIALSEVLGQIEIEKKQIKDNVITNAETLLLPIIQKLRLTGESRKYVQLLRNNLKELTSSFGRKLTVKESKLTSREIEVCNMIKNGLTSKEMASLLNISLRTAEKHRINIRRKLGIIKKDINLASFLKTF